MASANDTQDIVFTIEAELVSKLDAWAHEIDERVAREQVRTAQWADGHPMSEGTLRAVKSSIERGKPMPYYGAVGGAHTYCFTPTSVGCVVKVKHNLTGDEIDLTDYDEW